MKRAFEKTSKIFGTIRKEIRPTASGKFNCYTMMNGGEQYTGTIDGSMEHAYALELKEAGYSEVLEKPWFINTSRTTTICNGTINT